MVHCTKFSCKLLTFYNHGVFVTEYLPQIHGHAVITLLDNNVMIYLFLKVTPPFLGINFHLNVFKMDFISQV